MKINSIAFDVSHSLYLTHRICNCCAQVGIVLKRVWLFQGTVFNLVVGYLETFHLLDLSAHRAVDLARYVRIFL